MLAVIIHFIFLKAYPSLWRITPAVFVPSFSLGQQGEADCLCFLIYSLPILKITWPLSSRESSGVFPYCHYISRNQTVPFQWHWSALPAPVMLWVWAPGLVYVQLAKMVLNSSHFSAMQGLLGCHWALASLSPSCMSRKHFYFLLGRHHLRVTVVIELWCFLWYVRVSATNL